MKCPAVIESQTEKKDVRNHSKFSLDCLGNLLYLSRVIVDLQAINRLSIDLICEFCHFSLRNSCTECADRSTNEQKIIDNRLILFNNTPRNNELLWLLTVLHQITISSRVKLVQVDSATNLCLKYPFAYGVCVNSTQNYFDGDAFTDCFFFVWIKKT